MAYEFEIFGADGYDAYQSLFDCQEMQSEEKTRARRRWWCFDNPYGGAFAVAKHEGKVVATCYLGGKRLSLDNGEVDAYEIGETATDPEHQRKGLFSKLVSNCVDYGFGQGHEIIYGTPNRQSAPGYAKLGFTILTDPASWLFLISNAQYWAPAIAPAARIFEGSPIGLTLSADDYIEATAGFKRLNASNRDYLSWRFAESPSDYHFLKLSTGSGEFLCSLRYRTLGSHNVLVCSEYFLDGRKPATAHAASLLRQACRGRFEPAAYAGIYFHARNVEGVRRLGLFAKGVVAHRQLPLCLLTADAEARIELFQLSDCDIG